MTATAHRPFVAPASAGRVYEMGRMRAIFRADGAETGGRSSVSEWRLEARTRGPGVHLHEEDHVFYVIEGTLSVMVDGGWSDLETGGCVFIPGGSPHDFQNRGAAPAAFVCVNTPGGFEERVADIAAALSAEDLRLDP